MHASPSVAADPAGPGTTRRILHLAVLATAGAGLLLMGKGLAIHAKAGLAQILLDRSFERSVAGRGPARPWPWADFEAEARIDVPRLGLTQIVLTDAGGEALAFGPSRLAGTPRPGEPGTSVIAAHRDTHFTWLKDLRPGDHIEVTDATGAARAFLVRSAKIVRSDDSGIDAARPGRWLALATCWPFEAAPRGPLRYVVTAEYEPAGRAAASAATVAQAGGQAGGTTRRSAAP